MRIFCVGALAALVLLGLLVAPVVLYLSFTSRTAEVVVSPEFRPLAPMGEPGMMSPGGAFGPEMWPAAAEAPMHRPEPTAVVLLFPLVALFGLALLAFGALLIFAWTRRNRGGGEAHAQEAELVQDLHHQAQRFEERIQTLETLILERERQER